MLLGISMQVLNLVTNPDAPFYEQQVGALTRQGISETTLSVAGNRAVTDDDSGSRSPLAYAGFYLRVLRRSLEPYDVVHANYGLTAPMALAQPHRPVVLTLWGSDLLGEPAPLSKWCARRADAVIVMSEEMADVLETECHVIPHGIDLSLFRPMPRREARAAVGWRADARHVLFPYAAKREMKDYPRAERVVERVRDRLDDDIVLQTLHDVPHDRMPLYMNAADALLLTSKSEGSPNSVKEAMACNLPVVATDVGDVRERLSDVDPAHVCRTDQQLVDGLTDVLERGVPSDGREAIESLGVDRIGERIRAVYESVL
jgi:glycosyltransferase involved in cell wall biosynthesis